MRQFLAILRDGVSQEAVAFLIMLCLLPHGVPGSEVRPGEVHREHARGIRLFHDGVIERNILAFRERFWVKAHEVGIGLCSS